MNQDYDKIEEELKKEAKPKKKQKQSGRSVFQLQEIIKDKSKVQSSKKDGDGNSRETLAGDS